MTRDRTMKLLMYLQGLYPNLAISEPMAEAWHDMLKDYPAESVWLAIKFLANGGTKRNQAFAPTVGEVLEAVREAANPNQEDAETLWSLGYSSGESEQARKAWKLTWQRHNFRMAPHKTMGDSEMRALDEAAYWERKAIHKTFVDAFNNQSEVENRTRAIEASREQAQSFIGQVSQRIGAANG